MVGLSFIQYTCFEYLLLQTILYSTFSVCSKEFPQYSKQKSYPYLDIDLCDICYCQTLTIPGGPISTIYNIYINQIASLIVCICVYCYTYSFIINKKINSCRNAT